ncbi:NTP pyrophosphohydrolase [alpha proteobacterium AAP81b]|nr:NTP pyrophosphohydrolase [alpha proteobacterium AAP81b]
MRLILVAAAILTDPAERVLMAQRPPGKSLAGLWEFPGGKVEPGEAPEAALVRELGEELGITVAAADLAPFTFASHAYPDFHLLMPCWRIAYWQGEPHGREGQALRWVAIDALATLPMPPADLPIVTALKACTTIARP